VFDTFTLWLFNQGVHLLPGFEIREYLTPSLLKEGVYIYTLEKIIIWSPGWLRNNDNLIIVWNRIFLVHLQELFCYWIYIWSCYIANKYIDFDIDLLCKLYHVSGRVSRCFLRLFKHCFRCVLLQHLELRSSIKLLIYSIVDIFG